MRALFLSAERSGMVLRADYRAAFPLTSTALGRLFTIDSIGTVPQSDGSTLVTLTYDWAKVTDKDLLAKVSFPLVSESQLEDSLNALAEQVAS